MLPEAMFKGAKECPELRKELSIQRGPTQPSISYGMAICRGLDFEYFPQAKNHISFNIELAADRAVSLSDSTVHSHQIWPAPRHSRFSQALVRDMTRPSKKRRSFTRQPCLSFATATWPRDAAIRNRRKRKSHVLDPQNRQERRSTEKLLRYVVCGTCLI